MKTLIIYEDEEKKSFRKVKPQDEGENKFRGDFNKLAEALTNSDFANGRKNFHSFEVI